VRAMTRKNQRLPRISKAGLEEMIEQATVDAYNESEQITGWFNDDRRELGSAVRDHGAWSSGYRRTPRLEPCTRLINRRNSARSGVSSIS